MRLVQGQEDARLLFRLGLVQLDCWRMIRRDVSDERCVMSDSRVGEDVARFLVGCANLREIGWCR